MSPAQWLALPLVTPQECDSLVREVRRYLRGPLIPGAVQPLQRYRPGRHHVDIDVKPQPLPVPDPMDDVLTARLHRMADKMAPHYNLRG